MVFYSGPGRRNLAAGGRRRNADIRRCKARRTSGHEQPAYRAHGCGLWHVHAGAVREPECNTAESSGHHDRQCDRQQYRQYRVGPGPVRTPVSPCDTLFQNRKRTLSGASCLPSSFRDNLDRRLQQDLRITLCCRHYRLYRFLIPPGSA